MENPKLMPDYAKLHEWESYQAQLLTEYRQCLEEGLDVAPYEALFKAVAALPGGEMKERLADVCFEIVCSLPMRADADLWEPNDLPEIRRASHGWDIPLSVAEASRLPERIRGAWLGRICGCLLGKPFEGKMTEDFIPLLKATDNDPLRRYLTKQDLLACPAEKFKADALLSMLADTIECAPVDDDTNYTVLASEIVDRCGRGFTPEDVAQAWLSMQGKDAYCTAERVAYRNLVAGYRPPQSAWYKNPYREWIGAQIRADYYGYINPGAPAAAAEMAWRDASVSHTKNGIYGAMYAAALVAAAAVSENAEEVIHAAMAQIPVKSRLYRALQRMVEMHRSGTAEEAAFADIHCRYDQHCWHDWTHVIPNAEIVTASLLYGSESFEKTVGLAVQHGFDTDCNGATVGSVVGMLAGAASIPEAWTAPLNGTLNTSIFGVGKVSIDALVERTLRHIASAV